MTTYNPTISDDTPLGQLMENTRQQRSREDSANSGSIAHGGAAAALAPIVASPTGSSFGHGSVADRANSIVSTRSAAMQRPGAPDPFEHATGPGLRASIVETVNVLSKGGEVSRVMITGEIALSYRAGAQQQHQGLRIRIAHFEQFEKAAPNSSYLTPDANAPGEYTLNAALGATTSTVLKYQLHVPEGREREFVPLNVKAAWKCEPGQTRVIINYVHNPQFKLGGGSSASPFGEEDESEARLDEVQVGVPIGVPVSTFQAKPSATWSGDKARLTFGLDPVQLGASGVEGKLLASVQTEGVAVPQPVSVRWKVVGRTVSAVGVELVGEDGDVVEETRRETSAGKYLVAP